MSETTRVRKTLTAILLLARFVAVVVVVVVVLAAKFEILFSRLF